MAFPHYKTITKRFLFWEEEKSVPDGWWSGYELISRRHTICGETVYIGGEDKKRFIYCPACMVKILK